MNGTGEPRYYSGQRSVPCAHCGAGIGQPCRSPKGRVTSHHIERWRAVQHANLAGYVDGLKDALALDEKDTRRELEFMERRLLRAREDGEL